MEVAKWFDIGKNKLTHGDIGIEIEVEGNRLPEIEDGVWHSDEDGSLRGESIEYVLDHPLCIGEVPGALSRITDAYTGHRSTIKDSVRCGVHIHVNVQKLSIVELYNFITLYAMFEGLLLDYCGIGRIGNFFCLPLSKSLGVITVLRNAAKRANFLMLHNDEYRYCALNVKSLGDYGSLEFRALRSTDDMDKIYKWAAILLHLREIACTYSSPKDVIFDSSMLGTQGMHGKVFAKFIHHNEFMNCNNTKRKLREGLRSAQAIAFACDWGKLGAHGGQS